MRSWNYKNGVSLILLFVAIAAPGAHAHESLEHYMQVSIKSIFHGDTLDIYFTIAFTGARALEEREAMDEDGDGEITRAESTDYLRKLESRIPALLRLRLDGAQLPLIPLYEAELDLDTEPKVVPHPMSLKLSLFTRMPRGDALPRQVILDSLFFPETPALLTWDILKDQGVGVGLIAQHQEAYPVYEDARRPRVAAVSLRHAMPAPSAPAARPAPPESERKDSPRNELSREELLGREKPEEEAPVPLRERKTP